MASLITCPHCGTRPKEEFTIRGDAKPVRPAPDAAFDAWDAYVHSRDNIRGVMHEHWQHSGGCRRWLVVERDTFTHAVHAVTDAAAFSRMRAAKPMKAGVQRKAAKPARPGKAATHAKGRGKA